MATGVAVDGSGNVFIADNEHSAVKEIVAINGVVSVQLHGQHCGQRLQ
jgi:NHL repeat